MLFASKLIVSSGNNILNICDPDLLDKIIKDGKTEIKINSMNVVILFGVLLYRKLIG